MTPVIRARERAARRFWANSGAACSHDELIALRDALTAVIDEAGIGDTA